MPKDTISYDLISRKHIYIYIHTTHSTSYLSSSEVLIRHGQLHTDQQHRKCTYMRVYEYMEAVFFWEHMTEE